ncbi:MAG TPA: DUF167 domain-containing protein, partial [Kofleriaceae bacterium]|nr:DUF167 domain-containing protein [Kofleriaceae bacterium]
MSEAIRATGDGVAIDVLVSPRASRARFGPAHGDRIKLAVTAPPVDGEANAAVVELVARTFGVARGAVEVVAGHASRRKTVAVRGIDAARVAAAVADAT